MDETTKGRRSVRLKGYDYSAHGGYFITICTHNRLPLFGEIVGEEMRLNDLGRIVREEWEKSATIRETILLDEFIVMPNHLHGIVLIIDAVVGAHYNAPLQRPPRSLGSFVSAFKGAVTHRGVLTAQACPVPVQYAPTTGVWQRGYHDHIIRSERNMNELREYIRNNPLQWALDKENPGRKA